MSSLADLRPGDIGFARHLSPRAADLLVLAGQLALGAPGWPHHVLVVTEAMPQELSGHPVMAVQAMPGGAEEVTIGAEHWTSDYVYVRPDYDALGLIYPGKSMADSVAWAARHYVGTPYSFADYVALAGARLGVRDGWVRRYVTSSKHMICSQLADQAMTDAGWHVFDDGRMPQDVIPSALFAQMMRMPGWHLQPGVDASWQPNLT